MNKQIDNLLAEAAGWSGDSIEVEELFRLLALPDKEFNILAPAFLDQFRSSYENVDDRIIMAQAFNASGATIESARESYLTLMDEIEESLSNQFSKEKVDFLKMIVMMTLNLIEETEGIPSRILRVAIKKIDPTIIIPKANNTNGRGLEIRSPKEYELMGNEAITIPLGFILSVPTGYVFDVEQSIELIRKTPLKVYNASGVIDAENEREICVLVHNTNPVSTKAFLYEDELILEKDPVFLIEKGKLLGYLVLKEAPMAAFYEIDSIGYFQKDKELTPFELLSGE